MWSHGGVGAAEYALKDVAVQVGREAADLVSKARDAMVAGQRVQVETKSSDTDVVTAVDHASEELIRRRLGELRPGEPVLGEEGGGGGGSAYDGVTWVVDPIDGTVNFLYGSPVFAVSIAAQVDGVSVAGAIVEPVGGRCWTAVRGEGSWLDGRRLRVSSPERLGLALVATGFSYQAERRARQAGVVHRLLGHVRDVRRPGSCALDLCSVAAGWTDGYCEHGLHRWDWAAGVLIATEAGAVVSLPGEDRELGADATFAAAPTIAAPLRETLIACGAGEV